ncbi:MAG TPA: alpha/beta fold hydrolase [Pseudonocardiaceae bacterium]|nr:alpha/beta fold hydrolase [Pseudonocardiaceae bacterium]
MTLQPFGSWFLTDSDAAHSPVRVCCFPHAGGGPHQFLRWQRQLGDAVQLLGVVLPGRGHRTAESPVDTIEEYIDGAAHAVAQLADRPTLLMGHSLGALVAFEVARQLREVPAVTDLVASGLAAPSMLPTPRVVAAARLHGREFAEAVAFFGGLPPEMLAAEELYDLVLPGLYSDFQLVAGYRYRGAEPLTVRVHLVNGADDPHVGGDVLHGWTAECVEPPTRLQAAGGHFYFEQDATVLTELLSSLAERHRECTRSREPHVELI